MKRLVCLLLALGIIFSLCACGHEHTWLEPTCTEPRTCSECGKTEGEPLGHKWKDATCTEPKTCTVCGETEGEPLGHKWTDASCTEPKTCTVCGEIEGKALGHDWKAATYDAPKTCRRCGKTEGEPLKLSYEEELIIGTWYDGNGGRMTFNKDFTAKLVTSSGTSHDLTWFYSEEAEGDYGYYYAFGQGSTYIGSCCILKGSTDDMLLILGDQSGYGYLYRG